MFQRTKAKQQLHANKNQKKTHVAIPILNKTDFNPKTITGDKVII